MNGDAPTQEAAPVDPPDDDRVRGPGGHPGSHPGGHPGGYRGRPEGRGGGRLLLIALVLGTLLRGAYLFELTGAPDFAHPAVDAGFHDDWARRIAFPEWPGRAFLPDPEIGSTPYLRPPGYPFFLAAVYRATGGSFLAARVVQLMLGVATVYLVWRLGQRIAGVLPAFFAALAYGTAWIPVYFEGELHAPALLGFLLALHWNLVLDWVRVPRAWRAACAGLCLGLAALVRPNVLVLLPVALAFGSWCMRACLPGAKRTRWRDALLFLGCAITAIAPVTVRNARVSGEFVPVTTGLGVNLYLGNNPSATGQIGGEVPGLGRFDTCYDYPALHRRVERELGRQLSASELSSWFTHRALAFVREQPGRALGLTLTKLELLLGAAEVSHNKVLPLEKRHSRVLAWLPGPFPVYLALALLGAWGWARSVRRSAPAAEASRIRLAGGVLLLVSALALGLSLLPFFAAARYRAPLYLVASVFAGCGLSRLCALAHARAWGRCAAHTVAVGLLAIAWIAFSPRVGADTAKWHSDRGRALRRAGEFEASAAEYELALAAAPDRAQVHYEYALLLTDAGQNGPAEAAYRRAADRDPDHALARANLGTLLARRGDAEAPTWFEAALDIDPAQAAVYENLVNWYLTRGQLPRAAEVCERWTAALPGSPAALRSAAAVSERRGDWAGAVDIYERMLASQPGDRTALQRWAWILSTANADSVRDGRRAAAAMRALEREDAAAGRVTGSDVLGTLAAALAETGEFEEARGVAERALALARGAEAVGEDRRVAVLEAVLEACRAGRPVRAPR